MMTCSALFINSVYSGITPRNVTRFYLNERMLLNFLVNFINLKFNFVLCIDTAFPCFEIKNG